MLPITNKAAARSNLIQARLGGNDTISDARWSLLPVDQMQHSPVSDEEKKKYQEMILSRWPYIFADCFRRRLIAAPVILVAFLYIRFCARCTRSSRYWRLFSQTFKSRFCPISLSFSVVTRHRGQGQVPLSRIVARRTLEPCFSVTKFYACRKSSSSNTFHTACISSRRQSLFLVLHDHD